MLQILINRHILCFLLKLSTLFVTIKMIRWGVKIWCTTLWPILCTSYVVCRLRTSSYCLKMVAGSNKLTLLWLELSMNCIAQHTYHITVDTMVMFEISRGRHSLFFGSRIRFCPAPAGSMRSHGDPFTAYEFSFILSYLPFLSFIFQF